MDDGKEGDHGPASWPGTIEARLEPPDRERSQLWLVGTAIIMLGVFTAYGMATSNDEIIAVLLEILRGLVYGAAGWGFGRRVTLHRHT